MLAPVALVPQQPLRLPATLAAGIYLLEVRQGSETAVRRIVKE
ncbi:MAG: T9SS type A sorting domain-containing protein [Hymenobacter sp.]